MKDLFNLFKQPGKTEDFDAIRIGLASPEKIRSLGIDIELEQD